MRALESVFLIMLCTAMGGHVVFVAELCRHGVRSPTTMFAWDLDGRWNGGEGELTTVGMRQQWLIGRELRERYVVASPVLSPTYNETQVYFRSTDYNRTLMSAQSQIMGLFPANTGPSLDIELAFTAVPPISVSNEDNIISALNSAALPNRWQTFPVHIVPDQEDFVLQPGDSCHLLISNLNAIYSSPQYSSIANSNPIVSQAISQVLNVSNPGDYLTDVVDSLKCNLAMGYSIPAEFQNQMFWTGATEIVDELFAMRYQSDQNARLYSSGFFLDLLPHLSSIQLGTEPSKFRLYSTHDDTIAGILAGLQAYDNKQPQFASNLIVEVSEENHALYVTVRYNDQELHIGNCSGMCPLGEFITFLRQRTDPDIESICDSRYMHAAVQRTLYSVFPATSVIFLLGIVISTFYGRAAKPLVGNP